MPSDGPHEAAASTFYEEVKICAAGLSAHVKKFRNAFKMWLDIETFDFKL